MANKDFAQQLAIGQGTTRVFTAPQVIPPSEFFQGHLTVDGVVGGSQDMNVDGSVTPVSFRYIIPEGKFFLFNSFVFQMVDATIDWTEFGGIPALTNGIVMTIYDANDVALAAFPALKVNYEVAMVFGGGGIDIRNGVADDNLIAIFDVPGRSGYEITMGAGEYHEVLVQDNLTGLTHADALMTGRMLPSDPRS